MTSTITSEITRANQGAELLADGLLALITGQNFDRRYFGNLDKIWDVQDREYIIATAGEQLTIRDGSISFDVGHAIGNLSGIFPKVEYLNDNTDQIETVRLTVDGEGTPNFTISQSLGSTALRGGAV